MSFMEKYLEVIQKKKSAKNLENAGVNSSEPLRIAPDTHMTSSQILQELLHRFFEEKLQRLLQCTVQDLSGTYMGNVQTPKTMCKEYNSTTVLD